MLLAFAGIAVYTGALLFAGGNDVVRYRIPNAAAVALVAGFALFATALPGSAVLLHLSAGLAVILLTALCFAMGIMGGGDAKLLAAAALWTGWGELLPFLLAASVAGAALALALLVGRRVLPPPPPGRWYARLLTRGEGVPFGVAIALAGLLLLPRIGAPVWL